MQERDQLHFPGRFNHAVCVERASRVRLTFSRLTDPSGGADALGCLAAITDDLMIGGIVRFRLAAFVLVCASLVSAQSGERIGYHAVKTDSKGKLVAWHGGSDAATYDYVVRRLWNFWMGMKPCPNGVPYYLQHQVWKPEEDPRGLGGDQINMALSSWNLLYGYLGDPAIRANMVQMADYWLDHGLSRPDTRWPNLPYPYNTELHSGKYDGDMRAGKGFLQPDKAGSFGAELIVLYKMTGNTRYLSAAMKIADTLAHNVQPGDADNSPWPFRVNAATNEIHREADKSGKLWFASYTTNWTGALRLFADLDSLHQGEVESYRRASSTVITWLKKYPLRTNKWGPFFEDIPTSAYSDTEINADTLAAYILEHPDWSPDWKPQAQGILDWSYRTFANQEFAKWGVVAINEQTAYEVPGNSHTSRHASVELLACEKMNRCPAKEEIIRRLTWATYWVDDDGKNQYPRDDNWLTDGYGDYVRHFLRAMASAPELAPADQNHLLRTSSVVQQIAYRPGQISYTKFDKASREFFKIGAGMPKSLTGGEMRWDAASKTLTVVSTSNHVTLNIGN